MRELNIGKDIALKKGKEKSVSLLSRMREGVRVPGERLRLGKGEGYLP